MNPEGSAYFEGERHHRELAGHLVSGHIPVRYMYAGSSAAKHFRYARQHADEYLDGRAEHEIRALKAVPGPGGWPDQLGDIGPSNGVHSRQLLTLLRSGGFEVRRYLGLDFSPELLDGAREYLGAAVPEGAAYSCWNFEYSETEVIGRWRRPEPIALLVLGNTLGNVDHPRRALRNISRSCHEGDLLVLGLYLSARGDEDRLAGYYLSGPTRDIIMEPMRSIGVRDEEVQLTGQFADGEVTVDALFIRDVRLLGTTLRAGHTVRCFRSRRFSAANVPALLADTGWDLLTCDTDPAIAHAVIIARRGC